MARGLGEVDEEVVSQVDGEWCDQPESASNNSDSITDTATNSVAAAAATFVSTTPPRILTA